MVENILYKMIEYFSDDVKRINHSIKVNSFARNIGISENVNNDELFILEVSSILHDIGIKEAEKIYNSSSGKYQEMLGPDIAKKILLEFNININILDRIFYLIGNHHSYDKIEGIDYQILIESDFLVNVYEDNMNINIKKNIYTKYFKTKTGKKIYNDLYLNKIY